MTTRYIWLDFIRGLAFLMVIYSHLDNQHGLLNIYIHPVFLTTFFFVSGYLTKAEVSFSVTLEQRTRTLLIPFLILESSMILISQVHSFNAENIGLVDSFKELLFQNTAHPHINTMWFIPSLFVYSLVFHFLLKICNEDVKLLIIMALACFLFNWIYLYHFKSISLPLAVGLTGFACFYMCCGRLYKLKENRIDTLLNRKIFILAVSVYLTTILLTQVDCNFYGSPYMVDALLLSLCGLYIMIYIGKHMRNRFIEYVGANTLLYFAFHGKAMSFVSWLASKLFDISAFPVFYKETVLIVYTIVTALLIIIPTILVNKYCPQILGRGFKLYNISKQKAK